MRDNKAHYLLVVVDAVLQIRSLFDLFINNYTKHFERKIIQTQFESITSHKRVSFPWGRGGGRSRYLVFAQSKFWASVRIDPFYFASEQEAQSESKGAALGET